MWRYQYLTYAMVLIEKKDYETALLALSPLMKYCTTCMRRMDGLYIKVLAAIIFYRMQDPRWENEIIEAVEISREYSFVRPIAQFGAAVLPLLKECRYDQDPEFLKNDISGSPRGSHLLSVFRGRKDRALSNRSRSPRYRYLS